MAKPVRLQLSRKKGFNLQEHSQSVNGLPAVNVARPTLWQNPFKIGDPSGHLFQDDGDPTPLVASMSRGQVLEFYRNLIEGFICPEMHPCGHDWQDQFRRKTNGFHPAEAARSMLHGKNLACWCKPGDPCHADVLLELANPLSTGKE